MKRGGGISRTIVKAMGLFGGVQVANILCAIVRTKLVAVWIGPAGIGLFSLFNNAAEMVSSITSLGIRNSAVRDVALAAESRDALRLGRVIAVIKRWSWFVSIFSAAVMVAIAPLLSDFTFGSYSRTWDFILLSCVLMFYGLVNGEQTILQGVSSLRRLAHASVWGVAAGLLVSIPLFYFWGIDSIVTSIVVYQAMLLLFTWIFRHKDYKPVRLSAKEAFTEGKEFVKLGVFLTLSGFITTLFSYAFSVYLNRTAGTAEVGFFQAGYTLVNKYVGLIFTAIGMEYYPRLARVHGSRMRMRAFVSQEINISVLVLMPIVALFVLLREFMVSVLYSGEFNVIVHYISWAIVGTFFRAYSWCMAFVVLAKGDGRTYLLMETASAVFGFALNVVFYHYWGLTGLGVSNVVWYFLYCIIVGIVYFRKYRFSISLSATVLTAAAFVVSAAVVLLVDAGLLVAAIVCSALLALLSLRRIIKIVK